MSKVDGGNGNEKIFIDDSKQEKKPRDVCFSSLFSYCRQF